MYEAFFVSEVVTKDHIPNWSASPLPRRLRTFSRFQLMPLLHLETLPPRTTKGDVLNLLCGAGGLRREQVGRIDLLGPAAVIEVPAGWERRLVKALDGALLKERRLRAWCTPDVAAAVDPTDHFQRLARLLTLEAEAEAREMLANVQGRSAAAAERAGDALVGLVIADESSGLGGRCLL